MAILKIAKMGHPILKEVAKAVDDPTSREICELLDNMRETMTDAGGVGLAAPQIYVSLRVMIFQIPAEREGDEMAFEEQVLINPELQFLGDEKEDGWEGCLSVPDLRGSVPRFTHINYQGWDQNGKQIKREASGFHARVVQHEYDHLDGILYPMRMDKLNTLHYVSEMRFNSD